MIEWFSLYVLKGLHLLGSEVLPHFRFSQLADYLFGCKGLLGHASPAFPTV